MTHNNLWQLCVIASLEDEAEIIEIAVRQDKQRAGFGARLMQELIRRLIASNIQRLLLEVAETNHKALSFYHHFGFKKSLEGMPIIKRQQMPSSWN